MKIINTGALMVLTNYVVTTGRKLARVLTAETPVIHIPVRAGNLRTLHSTPETVRVRRVKHILVRCED